MFQNTRKYESIDLETRLYCLELMTQLYWKSPDYYPPQLIFADDDELSNPDEHYQEIASLLQYPADETESCYIFNFNHTKDPADDICRIIRPQKFYDPMAISLARIDSSIYRNMGYCPLHRQPDLVEYIEALTSLYGSALTKCLRVVNFEKAKLAANSPKWRNSTKTDCTMLDHRYRTMIIEPATALTNGVWRKSMECVIDHEFRFMECKGCRFCGFLDPQNILPVAQILGSEDLLPFILDSIQLQEMHRIRIKDKDPLRWSQPSQDFWKALTACGTKFSAKEIQCIRNTIPIEMLGKERYDAGTLFEYMLERFQHCRSRWGMKESPTSCIDWWKAVYQGDCVECYQRRCQVRDRINMWYRSQQCKS